MDLSFKFDRDTCQKGVGDFTVCEQHDVHDLSTGLQDSADNVVRGRLEWAEKIHAFFKLPGVATGLIIDNDQYVGVTYSLKE